MPKGISKNPEETKRRRHLSLLGNKNSIGNKNYWFGKERKGNKNPFFGKRHTEETKKKIGEKAQKRVGINSSNWKDGRTKLTERIRKCFKYRQWRSDVFTRDEFICQDCGGEGIYLEAHHIEKFSDILTKYDIRTLEQALECQKLWDINNGITFCRKCHDKTKKNNIV